jgi:MarR family transcriptional regulator, organic hydroperoxide resistance regulator
MTNTTDHRLTPEDMLCFDVYALGQAFGRLYKPLLDPLGLTYPQYLVMSILWSDGATNVGQVAERLGLETAAVTPLLKRLEAAGLVTRRRSALDERRVEVAPSPRGQALAAEAAHVPVCVEEATGMERGEIEALRGQIDRLRRAFGSV